VPDRRSGGVSRTCTASLSCGTVLTYETMTFAPSVGEVVPCRSHGYCPVVSCKRATAQGSRRPGRTVQRRSQGELLAFLSRRPDASVHLLRRNRFTLRIVTAAQRDGLVDVDLVTGRISLRSAAACRE
jgi:hypothetical protein